MKGTDLLYQGQAVTLEEMLQARDKRAARQRQALNCYRLPLISLTLVAPGAVKNSAVWRRVADYAIAKYWRFANRRSGSTSGKCR